MEIVRHWLLNFNVAKSSKPISSRPWWKLGRLLGCIGWYWKSVCSHRLKRKEKKIQLLLECSHKSVLGLRLFCRKVNNILIRLLTMLIFKTTLVKGARGEDQRQKAFLACIKLQVWSPGQQTEKIFSCSTHLYY